DKAAAWCERRTGKTLAPSQREALKTVLGNRVVVITGGPGVGKTTLVNSILMIPANKGCEVPAVRPNRTGCEATRRDNSLGSEDNPSPAGDRPRNWAFHAERVQPARLRSPGRGRDLHGGRAADALAFAGGSQLLRADSCRRRRPASVRWTGHRAP